ncbi:mannose-1-phosphate guanylyltransferase/mannose-6-phosphate isomerase [Klebsiella quasipneumoniae subsp. quasipneumoniae]|uniref:mannose-1-phosphate guanylyltransferase/mannose-6-phosphate isomerase n=1 Tax=Klebsiella quasipneumoniae TaxID=1463165 RepID=UPI00292AEBAB|nr:mannose-1-phosphate guanylyltransferase/mannose-6-phosphate isomerase [Klebsiella quasipneumoniae]MDV1504038.1 mannose-1-phosphate guanylyltransferase/mannose-6-phosphate isomerase [Klebsiella quasipneumoniae subsp. quasipneumoniae]MDV1519075.1 mannose-1-phosphate guanylyltransferase/mannose-6-phosphate isomerase [Klebsiella quasipneumoniae subsp. quasipneumoniae]MDV1556047.1 mannose-1-phosphate guanylyltransferase/mannose-6-phosphate isomerase [Klebsiella quasipneumoniae subsp. quasipneumoni
MLLPVIMAGGTGSRLWPMSRELYPKQFLSLHGGNSMLQETVSRLDGLRVEDPLVICNEQHRFLVAEQLRKISKLSNNIILEPIGRNTAPAIALAAFLATIKDNDEDPLLLVLAADHVIEDVDAFHNAVNKAIPLATRGELVTFGIVPSGPETGYGYIKRGNILQDSITDVFSVMSFVEKPDLDTAKSYVDSGEYYWNSGMFLFRATRYLEELSKFRPDIYSACQLAMKELQPDSIEEFIRIDNNAFVNCPDESVDYAVMEKTSSAVVVPLDANWNDVGSWSALWDVNNKNAEGNVLLGDVFTDNSLNCYINSEEQLVAAIGLNNLVIVSTKDALLVVDKSQVQDVKKIVNYLKNNGRREYKVHRESYSPWGHSDKIVSSQRYNINKVTVKPGGKFSLQMHHHRAEHWVVLSGTAKITVDDNDYLLTENQSTFIPVGSKHMLENPGKIPLEILEIQSGSYLEEDDIVRFKDHYDI